MSRAVPIARITVPHPQTLSFADREAAAYWLKRQAKYLRVLGRLYSDTLFRARYMPDVTLGTVEIKAAGALSPETHSRVAKWMESRAEHLINPNAMFEGRWFTQTFDLS